MLFIEINFFSKILLFIPKNLKKKFSIKKYFLRRKKYFGEKRLNLRGKILFSHKIITSLILKGRKTVGENCAPKIQHQKFGAVKSTPKIQREKFGTENWARKTGQIHFTAEDCVIFFNSNQFALDITFDAQFSTCNFPVPNFLC